jgi:23S rRNA (cytidine2498-2'-O)-methyltransferase
MPNSSPQPARKLWAVLAPEGFRAETERELWRRQIRYLLKEGDFFLFEGEAQEIRWSQVTWRQVREIPFTSINDAVKKLRPEARVFEYLALQHRGRGKLIAEQLRAYKRKDIVFPERLMMPEAVGAFTLLDDDKKAYFCRDFDRPDPLGIVKFAESKAPPSRAYLKLWEAFCLNGNWPLPGEKTMDLGSCPGGWTWVLASLGAEVLSVDRAPLEPSIAAMKGVHFKKGDAFQVKPANASPADWLCSDVICAPEKLLELVKEWVEARAAEHFVCTLKFQGEADPAVVEEFARLGKVVHLFHNKHELTFIR